MKIKDIQRLDSGTYELGLTNSVGTNTYQLQVIVLDVPGQPHGRLEIVSVDSESVSISWQAPVDNGGTSVTSYVVHYRVVGQQSWSAVSACTAKTRYTIRNLQRKETYQFKVAAENVIGCGNPVISGKCTVDYAFTVPDQPKKPTVSNITKTSAHISWKAPKDGPEVTGYNVELKEKSTTTWKRGNKNTLLRCDYTLTGKTIFS